MAADIHPTAIVDPRAKLGQSVSIGPFSVVEADVVIGDDCEIGQAVRIANGTRLGRGCRVSHGASLGGLPQDFKYNGEETFLRIGDHTVIREYCTLHRGTKARGETVVGSHCYLMAYCHVGHDCLVGDYFVAANACALAGHVTVGHHVGAGGVAGVVQFRSVGSYSFISAHALVTEDVVPFALVTPPPVRIAGINRIGLERAGFDAARRRDIRRAYRVLFSNRVSREDALEELREGFDGSTDVAEIVAFISESKHGLLRMAR